MSVQPLSLISKVLKVESIWAFSGCTITLTFGATVEIQLQMVHIEGCDYQIFYIISVPQANKRYPGTEIKIAFKVIEVQIAFGVIG